VTQKQKQKQSQTVHVHVNVPKRRRSPAKQSKPSASYPTLSNQQIQPIYFNYPNQPAILNQEKPIPLGQLVDNRIKSYEEVQATPARKKPKSNEEVEQDREILRERLREKGINPRDFNGHNISNRQDHMKFVLSWVDRGRRTEELPIVYAEIVKPEHMKRDLPEL
jgi:hypothetical protein